MDLDSIVCGQEPDPQSTRIDLRLYGEGADRRRHQVEIARLVAMDRVEHAGHVPDGPGNHEVDPGAIDLDRASRDAAPRRFETNDPAPGGRDADRATAIGRVRHGDHARRDGGA